MPAVAMTAAPTSVPVVGVVVGPKAEPGASTAGLWGRVGAGSDAALAELVATSIARLATRAGNAAHQPADR